LQATQDGTWTGIKYAGPDALIQDISTHIKEVIESYEIELNGTTYPIHAITNLGGHNIEPYKIHAGKLVLGGPHKELDQDIRMQTGECYAIETFATTGEDNYVDNDLSMEINHFMKKADAPQPSFNNKITKKVCKYINNNRCTLPFCTRWVENEVGKNWKIGLKELASKGIIEAYAPLKSNIGSYTSQWEHTMYLHEYGKEILTFGDDY